MDDHGADLYLLALLSLIDADAWRSRAEKIRMYSSDCRTSIGKPGRGYRPQLGYVATFAAGSVVKENLWIQVTDRIFHVNTTAHNRDDSHGYLDAEIELMLHLTANGIDVFSMDLRTPICFQCDTSNGNLQQIMILAMAQAARTVPLIGGLQQQRFHHHAAFRLDEVRLFESSNISWRDLQYAKRIVESGVSLPILPKLDVTEDEIVRVSAMDAFQVLFPTIRGSRVGVKHVRLSPHAPPQLIPAQLSAVRCCPSVNLIDVMPSSSQQDDSRHRFWPWLAYTLCAKGARHGVHTLLLRTPMEAENIAAMREIARATNPLALLYGEDGSVKPRRRIEVRRFRLLDPTNEPAQESVWTSPVSIVVDIIGHRDQWKSVLLPGYGRAWVHRDDIIAKKLYPVTRGIKNFEQVSTKGGLAELELAAELWGASLTTLMSNMNTVDIQVQPEWIERILLACPLLRNLQLPCATFATGCLHTIARMPGRLRDLKASFTPHGDASDLTHFFTTLADENHACTAALKTLSLRVVIKQPEDLAFSDSFALMLAENRSLRSVSLTIEDTRKNGDQGKAIWAMVSSSKARVQRCNMKVPVRRKCRLAFLSAMNQSSESAMSRLDSSMLAMIFEFAVQRITRHVQFQYALRR